jgi:hypothetical protein
MSFDASNLALVAYAYVNVDGSSPDINSGVITSHVSLGVYEITLPGSDSAQSPIQEGQSISPMQSLTLVTPAVVPGGDILTYPPTVQVENVSKYVKRIHITDPSGDYNPRPFSLLIYRPVISIPR